MLTVKNSILRSLHVIAGSLLFVVVAWIFLIPGDKTNKFIGWGCFFFFLFTLIKGVFYLFDRSARILIDSDGIYFPGRNRSIIEWSDIKEFKIERDEYRDNILIELKSHEYLHLKMFYLDIPPKVLHKHVENCMRRAAGLPDLEELRKNAGEKGLAEFVESAEFPEPTEPELAPGGIVIPAVEDIEAPEATGEILDDDSVDAGASHIEDFEHDSNQLRRTISNKVTAKTTGNRSLTDKSPDSEDLEDSDDSDELEDAEDPDASILAQAWHLPAWFSDEPVTNEIIWTGVLASVLCVVLFGFAYLTGDPPKISLAEQIMVVIAFGVLAPFFFFLFSFFKGTDTHREWAGLDTKKSVSYSVKAKKRAAAPRPQKTGESPRKARSKKHRR